MTEEKITRIDIIILKYTLKSTEGIFIAKINSTLGLSIKDSVSSFRKLNKLGLLEKKENVIF